MSSTKQLLKDLYERIGYLGVGALIIAGALILLLIAILIIVIINQTDVDHLDEFHSQSSCTDYNPCSQPAELDGVCINPSPRRKNGHNCSDWACLADDGLGTCQYDTVLMKSQCQGDCVGSCLFSEETCPEIELDLGVPEPSVDCTNLMCIYSVDFSTQFEEHPISCQQSQLLDEQSCMAFLNTSSVENRYTYNRCLRAVPICTCNNVNQTCLGSYLQGCQYYFSCNSKQFLLVK